MIGVREWEQWRPTGWVNDRTGEEQNGYGMPRRKTE